MRTALLVMVLALSGCATKPELFSFQGVCALRPTDQQQGGFHLFVTHCQEMKQ